MSPDAWAFIGLVVTNVCGIAAVYLQNHRQNANVRDLNSKVEPVSNGFAQGVMGALERIERRLDEHMRGHP